MLLVTIIFFLVIVFLFTRLFAFKKEVKKVRMQLQNYNNRMTNKKIDMVLFDKNIENLGVEINRLIDLYVTENKKRINFEQEQQQVIKNMSHDLRTPLTSIIGYVQMAKSINISDEERKELLSIAENHAKRLETLLNDFF